MENVFKEQFDAMAGRTVMYDGKQITVTHWKTLSTGKIVIHNDVKLIIIPNRESDIKALLEKFSPVPETLDEPPDDIAAITRNIRMPISLFIKIDKLARDENRKFTNVVEGLLETAVHSRNEKLELPVLK